MPSLLLKVQKGLSISAHRKVRTALEGEYGSVFKGRSLDFDDLREYIPGDDVKDIDWKATARSGQVLIRRYIAIRKHNILLVVDTGRNMAATAPSGEAKRDIAVMAAGIVAYVAQQHGDLIAMAAGDSMGAQYLPLKASTPHLERILQYIDSHARLDAPESSLTNLLDYVARSIRRRMMLVVITDTLQFSTPEEHLLRRLAAQHEMMFIGIDDADPSGRKWQNKAVYDVAGSQALPRFLREDKAVAAAYHKALESQLQASGRTLDRLQISNVRIAAGDEVVTQIVRLLEEQKHVRR